MGLKKGMTNNPAGKPKGAKNKLGTDLREKINSFLNDKWEDVEKEFQKLKPNEKLYFYERLMSYGLPKLQSIEYTSPYDNMIENLTEEQVEQLTNELMKKMNNT